MYDFFLLWYMVRERADLIKSIFQEPRRKLAPSVYSRGVFPAYFFPLPIKKYICSDCLTFSLQNIKKRICEPWQYKEKKVPNATNYLFFFLLFPLGIDVSDAVLNLINLSIPWINKSSQQSVRIRWQRRWHKPHLFQNPSLRLEDSLQASHICIQEFYEVQTSKRREPCILKNKWWPNMHKFIRSYITMAKFGRVNQA